MKRKKGTLVLGAFLFLSSTITFSKINNNKDNDRNYSDYFQSNFTENYNLDASNYKQQEPNYLELAKKHKDRGEIEQAIYFYEKAMEADTQNFVNIFEFASFLFSENKFDKSITYFKRASKLKPENPQVYFNISMCYLHKKDNEKTILYLKKSVEADPYYEKGYTQLGSILQKEKRDQETVEYLTRALESYPESFSIIYTLGKSLRNLDKLQEAKEIFTRALELKPNSSQVFIDLANTHNMLNENEKALSLYQEALAKNPNNYTIKYNIGYTLKKMGKVYETIEVYKEILKTRPDYPQANFSLALAYLLLGEFDLGWKYYEWRWDAYGEKKAKFDKPEWDGSNPAGKRILLCAEQGLGDTFQFIRYAKMFKEQGATVIVLTQRPLATILKHCKYIDHVIPRGQSIPHFDCYIYLMSIPLKVKTTVDTVPNNIPYLEADPDLVEYWDEKLSSDKNFKIGICWQGNKGYRTQALKHAVAAKSMHAGLFKSLSEIPGVSLYCLQKINGEEQLKEIDFEVHTFGNDFDNSHGRFMDTAAIIKNLDLVVTVDTSICHLAAALGTPVWTMLPDPADWRWMLKTNQTPWYPNMKLFRKKEYGSWENIMDTISMEICKILDVTKKQNPKKIKEHSNQDPITFHNMNNMLFEEALDNLILLKIKFEKTQDSKIKEELKKAEDHLNELSQIYQTDFDKLDELTKKLYDINSQLIYLDNQISKLPDKSVLNMEFMELAKRAQYVNNLKQYVKKEISKIVKPN